MSDNLDSTVYECFEQDPTKYVEYGLAVKDAMEDLIIGRARTVSGRQIPAKRNLVVVILGAGRGPIGTVLKFLAEWLGRQSCHETARVQVPARVLESKA